MYYQKYDAITPFIGLQVVLHRGQLMAKVQHNTVSQGFLWKMLLVH